MYSESDLENAVAAGVIAPAAATALRDHAAALRAGSSGVSTPPADEEQFRLLTGFNDIFVAIAIVLVLAALAQIGYLIVPPLAGALVAGAAWPLAEFFTRSRRMALPSILLLLAFVSGVASCLASVAASLLPHAGDRPGSLIAAAIGLVSAGAAWLHWRRFHVPITVAAGAVALAGVAVALVLAIIPAARSYTYPLLLIAGLGVFAAAMRWDMSDRERQTRRADVAFWLHLVAAPMIAHSVFNALGAFSGTITAGKAVIVLALYLVFALVALAVDRRALLVSSLVYVLYVVYSLVSGGGVNGFGPSAAVTGVVIGSALLLLSAFWQPMRRVVVTMLGPLAERLPPAR